MKLWGEAKRDDIIKEIIPGVETLDEFKLDKLDWASYLSHMGEWLNEGLNQYEDSVREHFDFLVFVLYGERIYVESGKYPEIDEMQAYMALPETKELIRKLTDATTSLTRGNWPAFRQAVCEQYGLDPNDYVLDFEK